MNGTAYTNAVRTYADIVYRTALSYTKMQQDAEDVTQTVFVKLLTAKEAFADEEHLRRWLIRVTVNECKNLWKSFWRRNVGLFGQEGEEYGEDQDRCQSGAGRRCTAGAFQTPETAFEDAGQSSLYEAVMALPGEYRIIVHLFYYEGYRTKEIAGLLHIREQTVRTRLVRARNKLKQQLMEVWQNEE